MEKVYFESGVEDSSTPDSKNTYIVMDGECGDDGAGEPLGKWNDILDRPLRSRPQITETWNCYRITACSHSVNCTTRDSFDRPTRKSHFSAHLFSPVKHGAV